MATESIVSDQTAGRMPKRRVLFEQINCLIQANQKLRVARGLLLPRLMSEEIAV